MSRGTQRAFAWPVKHILLGALAVAGCAADDTTLDPSLAVDVTTLRCAIPAAGCEPAQIAVDSFSSQAQVDTRLAGAWRFCGGADDRGTFGAGIELTPERTVFVLVEAADGSCRRSTEAPAATWYTFDISEQNPAGTYQLVFDWNDGRGTTSLVPTFSSSALGLVDGFAGFEFHRLRAGAK